LRLYTIPPSAPFLTTLAKAILAGELPLPGGAKPDPLILPLTTIYLPTRRAGRALREAFLAEAQGEATLLPRIRALGDPDEDAAIIFGAGEGADSEGAIETPAIGALRRRLSLMRLVLAFGQRLSAAAFAERGEGAAPTFALTPGQASYLAADLARLMDFVESEEVALSALKGIVPEEYAWHWQLTVEFLKILTEQWPHYLADNGLSRWSRAAPSDGARNRAPGQAARPIRDRRGIRPARCRRRGCATGLSPERRGRSAGPRQAARRGDLVGARS
jgi:ATP-dependent helicase/nuclease subunit B